MSLESRITSIDWTSLKRLEYRGSAIPNLLRKVCSVANVETSEQLRDLLYSLYQQETFDPDLAPVLPALLGLLEETTFSLQEELLRYLTDFLIGFSRREDWPLLEPNRPNRQVKLEACMKGKKHTREMEESALTVIQALDADSPLFLQVAQSGRGPSRLLAAQVAAYLPSSGTQGLELFAGLSKRAREPVEKAFWAIALGILSVVTKDHRHLTATDLHLRSPDSLIRGCAAVCRAITTSSNVETSIWRALGKLLQAGRIDARSFPWMDGAVAGLAASALTQLAQWDQDRAAQLLADGLTAQLAKSGETYDGNLDHPFSLPALIGEPLVALVFSAFWERCDPPLPEELNSQQRDVYRKLAYELEANSEGLYYVGLLHFGKRALRFLNEAKQGALDTRVNFEFDDGLHYWPVWKLWYLFSDGLTDFTSIAQALKRQLGPLEIWDICLDLIAGGYTRSTRYTPEENPFAVRLAERFAKEMLPQIEEYAEKLVKRKRKPNRAELTIVLTPLIRGWKAKRKPVVLSVLKPLIALYLKQYPARAKILYKLLPDANKNMVPKQLL
jgi:hypothetical protein